MKAGWILMALVLSGCVGSHLHQTYTYNHVQGIIERNNNGLLSLRVGMSSREVGEIMRAPQGSEGYEWGTVWLYRTAMTNGIYGTADSDFTPVVFDASGNLIGWGRNFVTERAKKYEIDVRMRTSDSK